jgi:hypothetical protein
MFFKKKNDNKLVAAEAAATQIAENVEKNFTVYTMPKRFLGKQINAKQARTTGMVVLGFGFVFLVMAIGFIYYYFVIRPADLASNISKINNIGSSTASNNTSNDVNSVVSSENRATNDAVITEIATTSLSNETATSETVNNTLDDVNASTTSIISPIAGEQGSTSSVITPVNEPVKIIASYAPDADGDGLTDPEEVIFGTDSSKVDSDGDSFGDLSELQNLYNPAGPGKILTNSNFDIYSNSTLGYSLYYPKLWRINDGAGDNSVIFVIDDKQFIAVAEQSNTNKQSIEDWYKQQMGVNYIAPTQMVNKKNWTGVESSDGLNVYLLNPLGDKIFTFSYNLGDTGQIKYKNILDMMVNSLK